MRDDMFKVIVERPRWGASHAASPKLKRMPLADAQHIGLKRHARIGARYTKSLNENLAPLVRYLRRQRGRPWDAVFSEICTGLDTGSTVKMHVCQHIEDFVLTRISIGRRGEWMFEGQVLGRKGQWFRRRELFVDPCDGILKDMAVLEAMLASGRSSSEGGAS
jgi:hypothetical protein